MVSFLRSATVKYNKKELSLIDDGNSQIKWLDYPKNNSLITVFIAHLFVPVTFLSVWEYSFLSLEGTDVDVRERLSQNMSINGTVAGLLAITNIQAFLNPPTNWTGSISESTAHVLVDVYAILNFVGFLLLLTYIMLSLLVVYPVLQGLRSDVGMSTLYSYHNNYGKYLGQLFSLSLQVFVLMSATGARLLYNDRVFYSCLIITFVIYTFSLVFTAKLVIGLDPITALHFGLSNSEECVKRADRLKEWILKNKKFNGQSTGFDHYSLKHQSINLRMVDSDDEFV